MRRELSHSATVDLNCDLGEGEPRSRTRALMRWISSANVACGGHAGDWRTMDRCVRLAKELGVHLGAHPGPWSRIDFGRTTVALAPDEFELLLLQQVGALERIARRHGVRLHHLKLHGALYHATEEDAALRRRYIESVRRWWPDCIVYARAGGRVAQLARRARLQVWEEAFADRGYQDDGSLVPRHAPNALINDANEVRGRMERLLARGELESTSGRILHLRPHTVCLHSDTQDALRMARILAESLRGRSPA